MKNLQLVSFVLIVAANTALFQHCSLKRIDPQCPAIDSISPGAGPANTIISIRGKNFISGAPNYYKVNIGDTTIQVLEVPDATTLKFMVPKGKSGKVSVTMHINDVIDCTSNTKDFTCYYTATMVSKLMDGFVSPMGIDIDNAGNIVVADNVAERIKVIKPSNDFSAMGTVVTIFGGGPINFCDSSFISNGASAAIYAPLDVAVDASGNIYFTENNVIRRINNDANRSVEIYAGKCNWFGMLSGHRRYQAVFTKPKAYVIDGTNFYFTDFGYLEKIDANDNVSTLEEQGTVDERIYGGLSDIAVSHVRPGIGPIFVTDETEKKIYAMDEGGRQNMVTKNNLLGRPVALAIDGKGNIFVADQEKHQVIVIYTNGDLVPLAGIAGVSGYSEGVPGAIAKFNEPVSIALNEKRGVLYVSDNKNKVVRTIKFE